MKRSENMVAKFHINAAQHKNFDKYIKEMEKLQKDHPDVTIEVAITTNELFNPDEDATEED